MKILRVSLLIAIIDFTVANMAIDHVNITYINKNLSNVIFSYKNTDSGVIMNMQLDFFVPIETMSMSLTMRRADGPPKAGVFEANNYVKPLFKNQLEISDLVDGKKGNFLTTTVGGAILNMCEPPITFPLPVGSYKFKNITLPSPIQFKLFYHNHMKYFVTTKDNPKKVMSSEWHVFGRNF